MSTDEVYLLNGYSSTSYTVTFDVSSSTFQDLYLGGAGPGNTTTFNQSTGTLTTVISNTDTGNSTGNEFVGYGIGSDGFGPAVYNQSGGTNNVGRTLDVGDGSYNLSGSGTLTAGTEYIGDGAAGVFTQNDSTSSNTLAGTLFVGFTDPSFGTNGDGSYTLNGGTLQAAQESISSLNGSTFTQTGGTNSVVGGYYTIGSLTIGDALNRSGSYALSGTGTLQAVEEDIGEYGVGSVTQKDTTINYVADTLMLGDSSNAGIGTYLLNSGTLTTSSEAIGDEGTGTFTQTGGENKLRGDYGSGGTVTGSSDVANGTLYVGEFSTTNNLYTQTGGQVDAGHEIIGYYGNGVYRQSEFAGFRDSGGSPSVNNTHTLDLGDESGATGEYDLAGGSLNATISETIGTVGTGTFNQTGGINTLGAGAVLTVNNGTYDLSGGTLTTSDSSGGFSTTTLGTFAMSGTGTETGYRTMAGKGLPPLIR